MQLGKNLPLIHHRLDGSLGQDSGLAHLFHGVLMLRLFAVYFPNFTETSLADAELINEGRLAHSYIINRLEHSLF